MAVLRFLGANGVLAATRDPAPAYRPSGQSLLDLTSASSTPAPAV